MASEYLIKGKLVLDISDAGKQLDSIKTNTKAVETQTVASTDKMATDWSKVGKSMSTIGSKLTKTITLPLLAAGIAAVKLSSDLTETMGKANVVFGDSYNAVESWANGSINKMGLAKESALSAASTFGDLATSMGVNTGSAADMSMNLVQLAADMASFKNISVDRANVALNGIFTGETESLKAMGIVMNEATLEQFAMNEGIGKTYKQMSQTEKVMLRYKFVMNSTKNAQGDFARTSDSVANQTRTLGERLKETGASFGNVLAPLVGKALTAVNNFLSGLSNMNAEQLQTVVTIAGIVAAVPVLILAVGKAITSFQAMKVAVAAAQLAMGGWATLIGVGVAAAVGLMVLALTKGENHVDKGKKKFSEYADALTKTKTEADKASTAIDGIGTSAGALPESTTVNVVIGAENGVTPSRVETVMAELTAAFDGKEVKLSINGALTQSFKQDLNDAAAQKDKLGKNIDIVAFLDKKTEFDGEYKAIETDLDTLRKSIVRTGVTVETVEGFDAKLAEIQGRLDTLNAEVEAQLAQDLKNKEIVEGIIKDFEETHGVTIGINLTGDVEMIDGLAAALLATTTAAKDLKPAIEEANGAIDSSLAKLKQAGAESALSTLAWIANLAMTGEISQATAETMTGQVISSLTLLGTQTDLNAEKQKALTKALQEGASPAEILALMTGAISTNMVTADGAITSAADGLKTMTDMQNSGVVSTDAYNLAAEQTQEVIGADFQTDLQKLTDAEAAHNTAISDSTTAMETQKASLDTMLIAYGEQQSIINDYSNALASGKTEQEAWATLEATYSTEGLQVFKDGYQGRIDALTAHNGDRETFMREANEIFEGVEDEHFTAVADAEDTHFTNVETANTTFYNTLAGIQLTHNTEELAAIESQMEQYGFKMDEGLKANYTLYETRLGELQTLGSEGGEDVGEDTADGIISGSENKSSALAEAGRQMIKDLLAGAQAEADIHSPSKKAAKVIGKPLAEGVGVGFIDNLAPLVAKVKMGTAKVITGASQSANDVPAAIRASSQANKQVAAAATINQHNNFTAKVLTPYEQRIQLKKLDNDLAEVFA